MILGAGLQYFSWTSILFCFRKYIPQHHEDLTFHGLLLRPGEAVLKVRAGVRIAMTHSVLCFWHCCCQKTNGDLFLPHSITSLTSCVKVICKKSKGKKYIFAKSNLFRNETHRGVWCSAISNRELLLLRELLSLVFMNSCIPNPSRKLFDKWSLSTVPVTHQRIGFKLWF